MSLGAVKKAQALRFDIYRWEKKIVGADLVSANRYRPN
jgi:hypothetical protein